MVIGLLICEVLEEEIAHLLSHDPDIKRVAFIESDPATDIIKVLQQEMGARLTTVRGVDDFLPDDQVPLEILAIMLRVGLHMDKDLLREGVKEQARVLNDKSDVLMLAYGLCGNVLLNIEQQLAHLRCPIVMPQNQDGSKIDDCVCMVLGGTDKYLDQVYKVAGTWFVTPGWLKHWETLLVKELHCPDIPTVKWIFKRAAYKRALMVDTGIGDPAPFRAEAEKFAETFGFYVDEVKGTLNILERAFDEAKSLIKERRAKQTKEEEKRLVVKGGL